MNNRIYILIVTLTVSSIFLGLPASAAQKKSPEQIKVFIFTASGSEGFVDPDQKQRNDSVQDLTNALDKKELASIVGDKDAADVTIEVLGRGGEETGTASTTSTSRPDIFGQVHSTTRNDTVATVRVALKAGNYSTIFEGHNDGRITNVWRTAANNAANQVEKWLKDNHENVISRRFATGEVNPGSSASGKPSDASNATAAPAAHVPPLPTGEAALLGVTGYATDAGFKITSVRAGSPAAQIFLNPGDVVSHIDGREVHSNRDIESAVALSTSGTIKVACLTQTAAVGMVASEREVKVR